MVDLYTRIALKTEFPFIVSIQRKDTVQYSHSVGVLIQSHLVLATCNLFLESVKTPPEDEVEEGRFKHFRLIASGTVLVENLQDPNAVDAQVRFIENVHLHPKCNERNVEVEDLHVWRYDIAMVQLSFPFHLNLVEHKLEVINFKKEEGDPEGDLAEERLARLFEFVKKRAICLIVGWGRFVTIFSFTELSSRDYPPSPDLLVSTVRLSPFS
ncbi:hypothetical protein GE061_004240 [Apolygus lucorum]|uniref:Peptidase S1 domain-containing protein n=1 Tax=Apolygus lucorum TaxID=248454 RepID=A0A8S9X2M3_APOLU|nr:hypothetical protein GE061_004240 [Apolygus lucorum]